MSRFVKSPISVRKEVKIKLDNGTVFVQGKFGELSLNIPRCVRIRSEEGRLLVSPTESKQKNWAIVGTIRSLLQNMLEGVTEGFVKKLCLVGIGYRVIAIGDKLQFSIGFSHIVHFKLPRTVIAECPNVTELWIKGPDKQIVGQIAAKIRSFRPPEPYKGRGIRYDGEIIYEKEPKKK